MGRQAERDTRGDSNWVPAGLIERIEVLRGPAAARYGAGAAGGVVNIVTKRPEIFTGSVGLHANMPDSDLEGGSVRTNFMLAGPMGENWSFRVFGNYNKSDPDSTELNADAAAEAGLETPYAGREGVVNKDLGLLLTWLPIEGHELDFEFNFSRQGNRYAGDSAGGDVQADVNDENLIGLETNRMLRRTLSATHRGEYSFGESHSYIQWENTRNTRNLNPNYVYSTMGMGCPPGVETPCEIRGNPDLEAETSFNKEIGVAYRGVNGIDASLTWFHNDYKNRIAPGFSDRGDRPGGGAILQWENTPEAVIEGIEGNFSTEFGDGEYALNLTKMIESRDKRTGNALSLVPDHTINASLDWYARDDLTFTVSATHYGRIKAAKVAVHTGVEQTDLDERPSYALVNLGMNWDVTDQAELSAGVNNIFNKQLFRTGQGANTFNEAGRAFYLSLNKTF